MLEALVMLIAALPVQAASSSLKTPVAVFEQACLATAGDREAFETIAQSEGWIALQYRPLPELRRDWVTGFRAGEMEVKLNHFQGWSEPVNSQGVSRSAPEQVICSVETPVTSNDWQSEIAEIVVQGEKLGEAEKIDTSQYQGGPSDAEIGTWRIADGSQIHATYEPSNGNLELSINYFPER